MIPAQWRDQMKEPREIDGKLCCLQHFIFTTGLLVGVTFDGMTYNYEARYCYATVVDALGALIRWDGQGDPPGPWVKEKVSGRLGPGALQ